MLAGDEDAAEIAARRARLRGPRACRRPAAAPGADPLADADRPPRRWRGVRPGARPPLRRAGARNRRIRLCGRHRGAAQSHRRPRVRPPRGLRAGQPRGEGADRGQESLARQEHVHLAHLRAQGRRHQDARGPARQDDGLRGSQLVVRLHLSDGPAADAWPRLRVAAQAHVRHRRLRAGRGPRLRSRARGRRAARRPTTLNAVVSAPSTMIEVAGLRVVLPPDVVAVDGVDLVIRPGEFVVILGRSGAGKTTFLRALNRLVEPTAGDVRVGGRAVTGADPATLRALRRQIGMVFQQFNLVRRASVLDNVLAGRLGWAPALPTLFGHFPAEDRRIALECLAQVGLADLAQRPADTLSGRAQPRVAIARALAQSPAGILADEPPASLDPALTGSIMDLLKTIRARRGLTLVVSQHQLETALAYATRVVGFREGRVVFDGPPAALSPAVASAICGDGPRRSPHRAHPCAPRP